jgi:hypothetical protein
MKHPQNLWKNQKTDEFSLNKQPTKSSSNYNSLKRRTHLLTTHKVTNRLNAFQNLSSSPQWLAGLNSNPKPIYSYFPAYSYSLLLSFS